MAAPESGGGGGGGSGMAGVIFVALAAAAFFIPAVNEIVFQWVPATMSVVTGVEVQGDLRNEKDVFVALKPVNTEGMLAQATDGFDSGFDSSLESEIAFGDDISPVVETASDWWESIIPISIFISLMLLVGAIYSAVQTIRIRQIEGEEWQMAAHPVAAGDMGRTQLRWDRIVEHANSQNPNDWRHAIIEADIMLDELLSVQGYRGETLGDKMKQVEKSDFNTIDLAWEAHKVRNRIAHQGSEHDLNDREVRRVIGLYQSVFREFQFI